MSMILSVMLASMALGDAPAAAKENDAQKVICKKFPPKVGSRLGARKVCATKQEWARQRLEQDTVMDNLQNRTQLQSN